MRHAGRPPGSGQTRSGRGLCACGVEAPGPRDRFSFSRGSRRKHGSPGPNGRSKASRKLHDTKPSRPKRARIPAPLRKALEAMWPAMPDKAKKALEEAGYQPPEPAAEEKDLVELLRTFEDKLPSEVIAALPSKPTLGPIEEGREVADKYAEAVRELRILGREKLDLQSRIDASKAPAKEDAADPG